MDKPVPSPECGRQVPDDAPTAPCLERLIDAAPTQNTELGPEATDGTSGDLGEDTRSPTERDLKARLPPSSDAAGQYRVPTRVDERGGSDSSTFDSSLTEVQTLDSIATRLPTDDGPVDHNQLSSMGFAPPGYEILEKLGSGGMGIVYKARQVGLGRLVALKVIRGESEYHPAMLERFRIEGQAVARLRHPNVVQIFEVGEAAGRPYFSLELLGGGSLADRIAGSPQPARSSAELLLKLAGAIQAAHDAGIVHRDLKPENVLFDLGGNPKVTDFGLAKRLDVDGGLTLTSEIMGTPRYMAPEQALGKNREVGPLTDVYSLGAILYAMLIGRPPIQGTSVPETLYMVVNLEPVAPSKLQPRVPRDLETICLKCLAKEPRKRYSSAGTLVEDLMRFLAGRPIRARRTPAWERGFKWARRHPTASTLAALGLASSIALAAAAIHGDARARVLAREGAARIERLRSEAADELAKGRSLVVSDPDEAQLILTRLVSRIGAEPRLGDLNLHAEEKLIEARRALEARKRRVAVRERLVAFESLRDEALFQDGLGLGVGRGMATPGVPSSGPTPLGWISVGGTSAVLPGPVRSSARLALGVFGGFDRDGRWSMAPLSDASTPAESEEVTSGCYMLMLVLAEAVARPLPGEVPLDQANRALLVLEDASRIKPSTRAYRARRASYLEMTGDSSRAAVERELASRLEASNAFDHLLVGQALVREGDFQGGIRQLDAAVREKPDMFWARFYSAIAQLNSTPPRAAEAQAALDECLRQRPDNRWLLLLRASTSGQLGSARMSEARRATPAEAETLRGRAADHFKDAEGDFARILGRRLAPDRAYVIHMNRGVVRFQQGRFEDALSDFDEAISLNPTAVNAHASRGQALSVLGRYRPALDAIDRAIAIEPEVAALFRERAALRVRGDRSVSSSEAAVLDLRAAIRLEKQAGIEQASNHLMLGKLLARLKWHAGAIEAFDAALAIVPDSVDALHGRVSTLLALERYDEMEGACGSALKRRPSWPEMLELRGLARVGRHEFAAAIDDFSRAISIQPEGSSVHRHRGWAYLEANAPELALHDFEAVVRLGPDEPEGYAGRGAARVRLLQPKKAVEDVQESLSLGEPDGRLLYNAARTFAQARIVLLAEAAKRGRPAPREVLVYESRSVELLEAARDRTPPGRRDWFLREVVERDPLMSRLSARMGKIARKALADLSAP